jgi:hypothetical protein
MFDWMLPEDHAIALLKKDHDSVKALFEAFEKAKTPAARRKIAAQALTELKFTPSSKRKYFTLRCVPMWVPTS